MTKQASDNRFMQSIRDFAKVKLPLIAAASLLLYGSENKDKQHGGVAPKLTPSKPIAEHIVLKGDFKKDKLDDLLLNAVKHKYAEALNGIPPKVQDIVFEKLLEVVRTLNLVDVGDKLQDGKREIVLPNIDVLAPEGGDKLLTLTAKQLTARFSKEMHEQAFIAAGFRKGSDLSLDRDGIQMIMHFEGCKTEAYLCQAKKLTIGIGSTEGVKPGEVVTSEEIAKRFNNEIKKHEGYVKNYLGGEMLTQQMFNSLVSWSYNTGAITEPKLPDDKKPKLIGLIQEGDYAGAAQEFGKWVNYTAVVPVLNKKGQQAKDKKGKLMTEKVKKVSSGLVIRRDGETDEFLNNTPAHKWERFVAANKVLAQVFSEMQAAILKKQELQPPSGITRPS